jgi:telomere length regulation protein
MPTWSIVLAEEGHLLLADQYFCPDTFSFALSAAGEVVLCAYSTSHSSVLTGNDQTIKLSSQYPIDRLHTAAFAGDLSSARKSLGWDDCLRNIFGVPVKAANAVGMRDLPAQLELATYFNAASTGTERLVFGLSHSAWQSECLSILYLQHA